MLCLLQGMKIMTMKELQRCGAPRLIFLSAFIGVPVHELSHALFCLLFGHKIKKIKLLQFDGSNTLGYVQHNYNPNNVYQQCGRFFIGVAPIIVGLITVGLLTITLFPNTVDANYFLDMLQHQSVDIQLINTIMLFHVDMWQQDIMKYGVWVFITASILSHITPSKSDLNGAGYGAIFLAIVALCLFGFNIEFVSWIEIAISALLFMLISCILAVVLLNLLLVFVARVVSLRR